MFVANCLAVNEKGHLTIDGCDTVQLVEKYGSPLYVMSESEIRKNCRMYHDSVQKYYGGNGLVCFASKAFSCKEIYRIMNEENMGIDVVSGGELYTAMQVNFPAEKIFFHGNNKTEEEMRLALNYHVKYFVVDNITELHDLNRLAGELGIKQDIFFRIKPGIDAHTHQFVMTGQIDSKFGFALETGEALEAVKEAAACENLNLCGLHNHIGSQIFEEKPFIAAAEVMMDFINEIREKTGITITRLNLGGGFGIKYLESDQPVPYDAYMKEIADAIYAKCESYQLPVPAIYMEPGRSITGEAGITLYTLGAVKEIPNIRTYVSVDGGMCDNPRYILYQSDYTVLTANKADQPADMKVTVAGRCCESGDLVQENTMIQKAEPGDILAVLSTGAYNYSMSSNYNRVPRPPVVMVRDGSDRVIVRGETYEDLIRNDI